MKILQINSVCGYGSTGKIAVDLYHALEKEGHQCYIAYGRGKAPDDIRTYRIGTDLDVYVHGFLSRITDKHGFYSARATKQFVKWMMEYDPDVIHLHNLHGYYINIEVLFEALKKMNKPVIWTLHDCWAFTGHCAHFDYVGCEKWKRGCDNCPQKKEYPASLICDNSKKNYLKKKELFCGIRAMQIVTPSEWLKQLVEKSFLGQYPVRVIHNGIDLDVFHPTYRNLREKYGLQKKIIILGVASEWGKRKGLQDFFKLAEMLDDNYHIVLIGHINGTRLNYHNITYISRTSDCEELAAWYTEADVFFNPTYEDTYPTVILEAQVCGTPVITYHTGGSSEGVLPGGGIVVDKGKWEKVTDMNNIIRPLAVERKLLSKEWMHKQYFDIY